MPLAMDDVLRLATETVQAQREGLEVVGAVTESGGSSYIEVLITITGCAPEECLISVGLDRQASEDAVRTLLADKVRAHLEEHTITGDG